MPLNITRRVLAALLFATTILAACSENAPGPTDATETNQVQSESERLNAFFEAKYQTMLERSPETKTYRGMKSDNDKWNDYSLAELERSFERSRQDLKELLEFDFEKLDETTQLSWRLRKSQFERHIAGYEFRFHSYPINQMYGTHTGFPTLLINRHRIDTREDAEAYIKRIEGVAGVMDDVIARQDKHTANGTILPKFSFPIIIESIDRITSGAPLEVDALEDNALLANFKRKIGKLKLDDAASADLARRASAALTSSWGPAYDKLRANLVETEKLANTEDGVWKLPNGAAFYNYRLDVQTTSGKSAEEIHAFGQAEVARIHDEMRALLSDMKFEGSLEEFFTFARTNDDYLFEDSAEGRQQYIDMAAAAIERAEARIDDYFLLPLEDKLIVKPVEKFRENAAPLAFYQRPPQDGSLPGTYFINTADMKRLQSFMLEDIAFHEGVPGHHYQGSVNQKLEGLPAFRRFGGYTAHSEGWGLYSEYLAKEMNLYSSPEMDFGRLNGELWRAMRLVADTGLHYKKWTREKTIDFMLSNSALDEGTVTNEVERYIVSPGQASSYKMGMAKILELRGRAEADLGDRFDIKRFHHEVLRHGGVPLNILEENIDALISDIKEETRKAKP